VLQVLAHIIAFNPRRVNPFYARALSRLARRATLSAKAAFLADLTVRHPGNDNGILLWHAGAPLSMRHPEAKIRLGHHRILPSSLAGMTHFRLQDGPITLARFGGDHGDYKVAVGEGKTIDGPETLNNYAWMAVDNWPRWERALMEGPFIHHAAMTYEHCADAVLEAVRYVPGLDAVLLARGHNP